MQEPQIREKLDKIEISYEDGQRKVRCFCGKTLNRTIVPHLKRDHPEEWENWCFDFVRLRNEGLSPYRVIHKFKTKAERLLFTSSVVQNEVQRLIEERKLELKPPRKEKIERWHPEDFDVGRETFWIFRNRGNWAVHQGDYRGNWAPQVPRALIDLYSDEGDIVLDPFLGGGTTLIETWLTNRRGFGLDINPSAIVMSNAKIQEMAEHAGKNSRISLREDYRPVVVEGDARNLKDYMRKLDVPDSSVRLVCTHPPYLNSLRYTVTINEDLSHISDPDEFCDQLQLIAKQIFDLLTENGTCAILIGDVRKNRELIPLGFLSMQCFLKEDFKLRDIIIKTQHKDSSTRFWYTKRDKLDFLLAHEYLFIFGK